MNQTRIQKLEQVPVLLDIYGCLLTERQREALSLFYEEDCSLSEIASLSGSSRQAAHNLIERGEAMLHQYESMLQIAATAERREQVAAKLRTIIAQAALDAASKREIEDLICQL